MLIQIIWRNWNDWKGRGGNAAEFTQMQTVKFPFCCKVSTQVFETKCVQCNLHKKRAYTQLSQDGHHWDQPQLSVVEVSGL